MFFPNVMHTSTSILLVMFACFDPELEQLDVKTSFLHGESEEQISMNQLKDFVIRGKEKHVCRLKQIFI